METFHHKLNDRVKSPTNKKAEHIAQSAAPEITLTVTGNSTTLDLMGWLTQSLLFKVYLVGFVGSFVAQTVTQTKFGEQSAWGINRGWQNEIAIWNVFAAIVLVALLNLSIESDIVVVGLFVLSLGFGTNHLVAYRAHRRRSNLAGFAANFAGLLLIIVWALVGQVRG